MKIRMVSMGAQRHHCFKEGKRGKGNTAPLRRAAVQVQKKVNEALACGGHLSHRRNN
jgi:hypothetical protein